MSQYDASQFPTSFRDPVYAAADETASSAAGIPPGLLTSIRTVGERSNANQTSSAGAKSVYQITPDTRDAIIRKYKIDPWSSPQAAALGAAYLLKEGIQRTGSAAGAVTQYIGGTDPANWGGQTRAYTNRVMAHFTGNGGQDTPQPDPSQSAPIPAAPLPSAASYGLDSSVVGLGGGAQQQPTATVQAPQAAPPGAGVNAQIVADYNAGRLSPEDMKSVEQRASKIGIDPSQLQAPQAAQPGPETAAPAGSTSPAAQPAPQAKPIGPQTLAAMQAGTLTPDQLATIKAGIDNGTLTMPAQQPAAQDTSSGWNPLGGVSADAMPTAPQNPATAAQNGSTLSDVAEKAVGGVAGSLLDIASAGGRLVGADDFANQANAAHQQIDAKMARDTNNSTAGKVAGFVGEAAPYAAMGGASLPGAVAGGAVAGAAPAVAQNKSVGEVARDAAVGAGAGAAGLGVGKVIGKGISALAENPTVAKGIARLQEMFGSTPSEATKVAASGAAPDAQVAADIASATGHTPNELATKIETAPASQTPGYTPTAAEMANDANVTTLQKANTNANPSVAANASANNDEAIAKALANKPSASGEVSGTGTYSDGGAWNAHYTTQTNTDGSVSLIRDMGNGPEHLNVEGAWSKGLPAKTRAFGANQVSGPESFPSVEYAAAAARDDIEGMGGKAADSTPTPGTPAAPQAAEQAGEAAAQKSDALAAQGQTEVQPLAKPVADRLQAPQFEAPVKLAKKIAADQGSTVFEDLQKAKHADAAATLDQITGTPEQLAAAKAARSADAADNFLPMNAATTLESDAWKNLAKRPTFKEAIGEAGDIAADRGEQAAITVNPDGSVTATGRGLLDAKQGIDGLISKASLAGDTSKVARYTAVKKALLEQMDQAYPEYGAARAKFAEASAPIDAMTALQTRVNGAINPATGEVSSSKLVQTINSIKAEQMKTGFRAADKVPDATLDALAALAKHLENKNDLTGLPAEGQEYIRQAMLKNPEKFAAAHEEFKGILDNQSPAYKELHGAHAQNIASIESQKTSQTALAQAQDVVSNASSPADLRKLDKLLPDMEAADRSKAIALRQQKARELALSEVSERNLNSRGETEFNRGTFKGAADKYSPFMSKEDASQFGSVAQDLHNQTTTYAKTGKIGGSDTAQNQGAAKRFGRNLGEAFKDATVQSLIGGALGSAAGPFGAAGGLVVGAISGALNRTISQKVSSITTENAAKLLSNGKLLASALRNYESLAARRLFIHQLSQKAGYVAGATAANQFNGRR